MPLQEERGIRDKNEIERRQEKRVLEEKEERDKKRKMRKEWM